MTNRRSFARATVIAGALAFAAASGSLVSFAAQAAEPLKIGFSMALTGGLAGAGKAALIAMELWREDVNKKGGLLGRPVEFVYYDDATQPAKVPGIYTKLLNVDKVDLGPRALLVSVSNGAAAVSPVAVALDAIGASVAELTLRTPTLDDVFLELTGDRIEVST